MRAIKENTGNQRGLIVIITALVIVLTLLWFSDVLPLKVAEIVATNYMSAQDDGDDYVVTASDYSPAHDCYFIYFTNEISSKQRNIGIYYRYFPFDVYFDSDYPG